MELGTALEAVLRHLLMPSYSSLHLHSLLGSIGDLEEEFCFHTPFCMGRKGAYQNHAGRTIRWHGWPLHRV